MIALAFHFQQQLVHFRSLGLFGIFLVNLLGSAMIFLPAPGIATVVAGGGLYSPFWVGIVAAVGSSIGELTGVLLGRSGKQVFLNQEAHPLYTATRKLFDRHGGLLILVVSFIPNPFFDVIGIMAGAMSYSPVRFFCYVLVGRIARDLLLAYFGHRMFG